jgi:lipoyl-dependent peroxiredoxin
MGTMSTNPTAGQPRVIYTAEAISTGEGRNGHVRSSDGRVDLELTTPTGLGGRGEGSNPEQLFASGYAACFHSALRGVAGRQHADVEGSSVTAYVSLIVDGEDYNLAVRLVAHLPAVEGGRAEELAHAAHQVCPYSRATRGNIPVDIEVG